MDQPWNQDAIVEVPRPKRKLSPTLFLQDKPALYRQDANGNIKPLEDGELNVGDAAFGIYRNWASNRAASQEMGSPTIDVINVDSSEEAMDTV